MATERVTAPTLLTFGQLSVVRALQRLPVESWPQTYLSTIVAVPPPADLPAIRRALKTLAGRHESLRTHFVETAAGPMAMTMPGGHYDFQVVEVPGYDETAGIAAAEFDSRRQFRWESEFAWRAVIVTDGRQPRHVLIVVDHLVADAWGLRRLAAELRALLGAPDQDGGRWLAETPPQPGALALVQRSAAWHPRRCATDRYWDRLLRELPPEAFPWPTARDDAGRIEAVLASPRARFALGLAAHHLAVSPQGVMLALTAVAAATVLRLDPIVLTLQASNRFDRRWREIVTSMNQATPLPVAVGASSGSFAEFARGVHWASLNSYRHGCYDIDRIAAMVRRARGDSIDFDCFFNFMANDVVPHTDAPPPDGLAPSVRVRTRPHRQVGPRFDVKVRGGVDMPLVVRADPTILDESGLDRLLAWFEDEIGRLGKGEAVAIEDTRRRCQER